MFKFMFMNLRPFMDADSSVGGGVATPQDTGSSTETTSTSTETTSTESGEQTGGVTDTNDTDVSVADTATQPKKQTPEQDRAFAEARRRVEAAERRAAELEAMRQRDIEVAKKYGQYGIYSDADVAAKYGKSHGLNSIAQFEEALRREEYREKGIDPDVINNLIENHPAIQQAKAYEQAMIRAQEDNFLVSSFNELQQEYPDIKEVADVPLEVWRQWKNGSTGLTLNQAYLLVNHKQIVTKQAEAAKQATLNNIQGKGHVRGNGQGTEVDTTRIPDDILEMYKKFNPGRSMDEYKKHYKQSLK
jgi:hypothetical protein